MILSLLIQDQPRDKKNKILIDILSISDLQFLIRRYPRITTIRDDKTGRYLLHDLARMGASWTKNDFQSIINANPEALGDDANIDGFFCFMYAAVAPDTTCTPCTATNTIDLHLTNKKNGRSLSKKKKYKARDITTIFELLRAKPDSLESLR